MLRVKEGGGGGGGFVCTHEKTCKVIFFGWQFSHVFIKQYRYNLNQGNWNKLRVTVQELTSNYFTEVCLRKKLQVEIYQTRKFTLFLF